MLFLQYKRQKMIESQSYKMQIVRMCECFDTQCDEESRCTHLQRQVISQMPLCSTRQYIVMNTIITKDGVVIGSLLIKKKFSHQNSEISILPKTFFLFLQSDISKILTLLCRCISEQGMKAVLQIGDTKLNKNSNSRENIQTSSYTMESDTSLQLSGIILCCEVLISSRKISNKKRLNIQSFFII